MRLRVIVPTVLAIGLALAGCGGSSSPKANPATQPSSNSYKPAGANPSVSAKMICEKEAINDIASTLGVHTKKVTTPTWTDHTYACTYVYPKGSFTMSVKELVDTKTTTDYFNSLKSSLGAKQKLIGLGQGAFIAKNDDVVVRKDYKVLHVDVQKVPANFVPAMKRADVAENIAVVIMGCWSGA
jgi:hypothetical protein